MSRFIYMADSHFGADPMDYQMQPGYPDRLEEIVGALADWMRDDGGIDFILHGGDMVELATEETIDRAAKLFDLPAPVHLCLGNHDVTERNAVALWQAKAPELLGRIADVHNANYSVDYDDCLVHIVPTHWCEEDYYWQEELTPQLRQEQIDHVLYAVEYRPDRFQILLTHSPMLGVPAERTGLDHVFHGPPEAFTRQLADLIDRCDVGLVLGAHSHVNMRAQYNGAEAVTVSALAETPFEFKLIEIEDETVRIETIALADRLGFRAGRDETNAWIHGRPEDRCFAFATNPGER